MNVYNAVEDAYLTLNGQYIANLSDARMIVREEVKVENMLFYRKKRTDWNKKTRAEFYYGAIHIR